MKIGTALVIGGISHEVHYDGPSPETARLIGENFAGSRPLSAMALGGGIANLPGAYPVGLPKSWRPGPAETTSTDAVLDVIKTIMDQMPQGPGIDLPVAFDVVGAVLAGHDLLSGQPGGTVEEKILVYSSNVLDIASLLTDVVPALHSAGHIVSVLSLAVKFKGQELHSFSLRATGG